MSFDPVSFALGAASGGGGGAGGGGGLIVTVNEFNSGTADEYAQLDKTAGEIYIAFVNGKPISFRQIVENSEDDASEIQHILGVLTNVEYATNGDLEYFLFKLARSGNNSFYLGEYACIGRDNYPSTRSDSPEE